MSIRSTSTEATARPPSLEKAPSTTGRTADPVENLVRRRGVGRPEGARTPLHGVHLVHRSGVLLLV